MLLLFLLSFFSMNTMAISLSSKIQLSVEKYQLDNGLTVILNTDKNLSTASYILGIKVGSRHEKPGITGISHMFEHLMFRGTTKYPKLDEVYQQNGVVGVNAFTAKDITAYHAIFAPSKLELILDVESDRMSNLILTQELLDKERKAVQEERLMRVDNNPTGFLYENLFSVSFTQHPYRHPIIGYPKDIANYKLEDLNMWYNTYYSPNNAVLVLSGSFSKSKAKTLIQKYFGNLKSKQIPKEAKIAEPEQQQYREKTLTKDLQSSTVIWSFVGPHKGTKEAYALEFIGNILGAGESSILYKKLVRDKKLLKSISVYYMDYFHQNGLFIIAYSLLDLSKEEQVKQMILEEIQQGIDQALNKKSMEKVKNILMQSVVSSLKKSSSRARALLSYEIAFNDYRKMYQKLDSIDTLSPEFIQSTSQKYLQSKRLNYLILKPNEL